MQERAGVSVFGKGRQHVWSGVFRVEALVAFYTDLYWIRDQQDIEDKKERVHDVVEKRQRAMAALRDAA